MGVLPAYQGQQIGYRLKLAQREHVLQQGLQLITWTYDPLESRNASLNLHKLGAVCKTYLRDVYGEMRNALNQGLASDRFQVDWHITSQHVRSRVQDGPPAASRAAALRAAGVPLVERLPLPDSPRLLVEIPGDLQALKANDMAAALHWRQHTRAVLEAAFATGYSALDLLVQDQQWYYLLQHDWSPV
jgi:predicted GNAT superfamily acetyltransferase